MEPTNRPYVDPATEPGDAGTEPWAVDGADAATEDPTKRRPIADPVTPSEEEKLLVTGNGPVKSEADPDGDSPASGDQKTSPSQNFIQQGKKGEWVKKTIPAEAVKRIPVRIGEACR